MKTFLVVENALYQFVRGVTDFTESNTRLGDVFFFDEGVAFVPYAELHIAGILEQGFATVLGLMSSPNAAIGNAAKSAKDKRNRDWGLAIQDRIAKNKNSVLVTTSEITRVEIGDNTIVIHLTSNSSYGFAVKQFGLLKDDLVNLSTGKETFNRDLYDQFGMGIQYTAPAKLIDMVLSGDWDSKDSNQMLNLAAADKKYMDTFCACFGQINLDEKTRAAPFIAQFPKNFRDILVKRLRRERIGNRIGCLLASLVLGVPLFFITLIIAAMQDSAGGAIATAVGFVIYMFACFRLEKHLRAKKDGYLAKLEER